MAPLSNKKIVIVGGSSGIGFGVARAALSEGAAVTICSSSAGRLQGALTTLGAGARGQVRGEVLDVVDEAAVRAFFAKTGEFDHLVITAGEGPVGGFPGIEIAGVKSAFDVRFWGMLLCAQHAQPYLRGSLTVTSGTSAHRPVAGWAIGAGIAGAMISAARSLALDLAPVRANCVTAGLVDTAFWGGMADDKRAEFFKARAEKFPVGHVGTPDEVAEAYLFAMKCEYLTGQSIVVDGGGSLV